MSATHDADHTTDDLHDPVTGLATRALFLDRLQQARARGSRRDRPLAIALLEVGLPGLAPDAQNPDVDEQILRAIAERLTESLRADDTVARQSGAEFAILIEDLHNATSAQVPVHRVLEALRLPLDAHGRQVEVTASCGLAVSLLPHVPVHTLLQQATAALQRARKRERTGYVLFDAHLDAYALKQLASQADHESGGATRVA